MKFEDNKGERKKSGFEPFFPGTGDSLGAAASAAGSFFLKKLISARLQGNVRKRNAIHQSLKRLYYAKQLTLSNIAKKLAGTLHWNNTGFVLISIR